MNTGELIDTAYRSFLNRGVDPTGLATFMQAIDAGEMNTDGLIQALIESEEFRSRAIAGIEERGIVNGLVKFNTRFVVQGGPFTGMKMLDLSNRGDGDISPKLLGTYEQELHPFIERASRNRYDAVVDIGCAEGYFAVGFARLFPSTPVLAYDTDQVALAILHDLALLNDCQEQIIAGEFCDPIELKRVFERYPRSLIVADCEGYEKILFTDPHTNKAGASADIIVECHDLWDHSITPSIIAALSPTHEISTINAIGREPNVYDFLAHLSDIDRFKAVWERRGARQNWLVCEARQGVNPHVAAG
jgi:hypothetical protein